MVCPAETPEGQACGLVKNLSLMALVSVGAQKANTLGEILKDYGVEDLDTLDPVILQKTDIVKVFVNGNWIGCHRDATELYNGIKEQRRMRMID
jgi:DNA-directed RNA polymerase II subunit RPB2